MNKIQQPTYKKPKTGQHLRLTLETDGKRVDVLQAMVIKEPLIPQTRVIGPFVYKVFFDRKHIWLETLPDPLIRRSAARPNEREHFIYKLDKGTFVIHVPLPNTQLPKDLCIKIFKAKTHVPERVSDLNNLMQAPTLKGFEVLGTIDLPSLMRHPDWKRILTDSALSVEENGNIDTKDC